MKIKKLKININKNKELYHYERNSKND